MEGGSSRNGIKCVVVCKKKKGKKIHYYKCKVPFASIVLATALQKAKLVYLEIRGKRIQSLLIAPQFVTFTPPPPLQRPNCPPNLHGDAWRGKFSNSRQSPRAIRPCQFFINFSHVITRNRVTFGEKRLLSPRFRIAIRQSWKPPLLSWDSGFKGCRENH